MENQVYKTTYIVPKMDCPSEVELIKMKLQDVSGIISIDFDIPKRRVDVYHFGEYEDISRQLYSLNLGACFLASDKTEDKKEQKIIKDQRRVLIYVLIINLFFFCLEVITGFLASSMGLVADSLDMLADSIVYGLSLFVVGAHESKKKMVASISGYFQGFLAIFGFIEVIRRFAGYGENPDFIVMIVVSLFALTGNIICLYILQKAKSSDAHIQASMIFTSNDVIVNTGVITAGILVYATASRIPDLVVGAIVFFLVGMGAYRIIKLSR